MDRKKGSNIVKLTNEIIVDCNGPIAIDSKWKSQWEDVQLSWIGKLDKEKYNISLRLISKTSLERAQKFNLEMDGKYVHQDWSNIINEYKIAIGGITTGKIYIEDPADRIINIHTLPANVINIYTQKEFIDRNEAEEMAKALIKLHGFNDVCFKWNKPKSIAIFDNCMDQLFERYLELMNY